MLTNKSSCFQVINLPKIKNLVLYIRLYFFVLERIKSGKRDLNPRHPGPKPDALPAALLPVT